MDTGSRRAGLEIQLPTNERHAMKRRRFASVWEEEVVVRNSQAASALVPFAKPGAGFRGAAREPPELEARHPGSPGNGAAKA